VPGRRREASPLATAFCDVGLCSRALRLRSMVLLGLHEASPSSMSTCHVPSGLRRITTTPSILARSELVAQWVKAVSLCGIVTRMPPTLREAVSRP
jgi:hypothetical protein